MKWTSLLASLVLGLAVCTPGYSFELLDQMLGSGGCGCQTSCCETKGCRDRCNKGCGRSCGGWFNGCGCKDRCGCSTPTCTKAAAPYQAPTCAAAAVPCTKAASPYQAPTCEVKAASPHQAPGCGMDHVQKDGCCKDRCGCRDRCSRGCFFDRMFACNKGCGCNNGCTKAASPHQAPCQAPSCGCKDRCNKGCRGSWFGGCGCKDRCGCTTATCTKAASPYQAPSCGCDYGGGKAAVIGGDVAPMPPAPVVDPSAYIPTQRRVVQASTSLVR